MAEPETLPEGIERLRLIAKSIEGALRYAYTGSAEHGSFLRDGSAEYVPSVFMLLDSLYDGLAKFDRAARAEGAAHERARQSKAAARVAYVLEERADELDKAACDRCEDCGDLFMCSFHSVLSILSGDMDQLLAARTPPTPEAK